MQTSKSKHSITNLHKISQIDRSDFEVHELVQHDAFVSQQEGSKEKDRIVSLPGQHQVSFAQYGGYVTVDPLAGSAYYYYFVEAHGSSTDSFPLLLWLNGGKILDFIIRKLIN